MQVQNLLNERQPFDETPHGILCTVWFNNVLFLGGRARNEHHRIKIINSNNREHFKCKPNNPIFVEV